VNFNFLFNTKSWQSVLAANVDAAFKRSIEDASGERHISLIDCETALDHMLLSIRARRRDEPSGRRHLITGASARLTLRAAPDIRLNAGVSNFWRKRTPAPGLNLTRPSAAQAARGPTDEA
jgi:REP element-mobilizing transposase RayT